MQLRSDTIEDYNALAGAALSYRNLYKLHGLPKVPSSPKESISPLVMSFEIFKWNQALREEGMQKIFNCC